MTDMTQSLMADSNNQGMHHTAGVRHFAVGAHRGPCAALHGRSFLLRSLAQRNEAFRPFRRILQHGEKEHQTVGPQNLRRWARDRRRVQLRFWWLRLAKALPRQPRSSKTPQTRETASSDDAMRHKCRCSCIGKAQMAGLVQDVNNSPTGQRPVHLLSLVSLT
jgi:hypothetical protein